MGQSKERGLRMSVFNSDGLLRCLQGQPRMSITDEQERETAIPLVGQE